MTAATPFLCGFDSRRLRAAVLGLCLVCAAWAWDDRSGAWSPDGTKIVFSSDRDGRFHLYVVGLDGKEPRALTSGDSDDLAPAWAPDGSGVYFDSNRDRNRDLFFVSLEGGSPRRLFPASVYINRAPVPDRDGTGMLFESNRERDGLTRLYLTTFGSRDVWLLNDAPQSSLQPAWTQLSRRIVFRQRENPYNVAAELWVVNDNGTALRPLTQLGQSAGMPDWSPDGLRVVFQAVLNGNNEIYSIGYDGTDLRRLTNDPADDEQPRYSPDGRMILFSSNRSGSSRLHVMRQNGAKVRPLLPAETPAK